MPSNEPSERRIVAVRVQQVSAAFITPDCRANRGEDGAWQEAVDRLRAEYDAVLEGWRGAEQQPTLNLVLELERSRG